MTLGKRLRFFGFGIVLGTLLSIVLFGPEKFSCSGYLPQGRVLAELETKHWENDTLTRKQLAEFHLSEKDIKDKILKDARIDFDASDPRKKPCGQYSIYYPKDSSELLLIVYKCDSTAYIEEITPI